MKRASPVSKQQGMTVLAQVKWGRMELCFAVAAPSPHTPDSLPGSCLRSEESERRAQPGVYLKIICRAMTSAAGGLPQLEGQPELQSSGRETLPQNTKNKDIGTEARYSVASLSCQGRLRQENQVTCLVSMA